MKHLIRKTFRPGATTFTFALLSATPLMSSSVFADVTAIFNAGGGDRVTIEYRDEDHVRMSAADGGYMIITDGEGYVASRDSGQWQVFALKDMAAMMERIGINGSQIDIVDVEEDTELRDTGRTETIAGIVGQVYEIVQQDGPEQEVVGEIVLTDDPEARDAYRGLMRITGLMGELAGVQSIDTVLGDRFGITGQAVLRADDWQLASISDASIPDTNFELPAEPMSMPNFGGSGAGSGDQGGGAGLGIGSWLGNEAQAAGEVATDEASNVAEETEQEARESTTESIRSGVRRGLRSIFN